MESENVQTIEPEKLRNWQGSGHSENPGAGSSNNQDEEFASLELQELISRQKRTLGVLKKVGNKVVNMVDNQAKKAGRPGIGDEQFRKDYVEIGMVWVEQMAGRPGEREKIIEFLKKAPGYTFGILSLGILARNGLSFTGDNEQKRESEKHQNNAE